MTVHNLGEYVAYHQKILREQQAREAATQASSSLPASSPSSQNPNSRKGGVNQIYSKQSFESSVLKNEGYVIVDYFATWCGPCKVIAPKIEQLSHSFTNIDFYKLDVDQVPDVAAEQGIRAMPTIILYKNGKVEKEIVGADLNGIQNMITAASTNPSA